MCGCWGLAPKFLGNKKGTLEFAFCVLLLACTLMKVRGQLVGSVLLYTIWVPGIKTQVIKLGSLHPHNRLVDPKFVFLVISGIPKLMVFDFWGTLNNMWRVLAGETGSKCSWYSFYHALSGTRAPRNRNLGTLCPWLQHGCWPRAGRNTGHCEWAYELIRANGMCPERYQKHLHSGLYVVERIADP